jgi:hypothetical protein
METVSVDREYDAPEHRVRSVLEDVTGFLDAAGFDVARTDDRLNLSKRVAVAQFELHVKLHETESTALAYEQVSGPFEMMATRYHVDSSSTGSYLTIETSFKPPATGFGSFLNRAVVKRQRQAELDAVSSLLEAGGEAPGQNTDSLPVGTEDD